MVAAKDDFYNRHIMKFNLFDPIVQLFVANGKKYNLINSAVIELFDYIRKVGLRLLTPWPVKHRCPPAVWLHLTLCRICACARS
jgi:protein phosphatase-4 regulatory subunit 3